MCRYARVGGCIMYRTFLRSLLFTSLLFLFVALGAPNVFAKRPPWAGGPESPQDYEPPVSAPEPTTLSLIAVVIAGGAGYHLIRRKQKK